MTGALEPTGTTPTGTTGPRPAEADRVSNLELFFDLVFVFTVTQLTAKLAEHFSPASVVQVMIMLGVIWWMYAGYAWLTNAIAPNSMLRRGLLLVGMSGFLGIALAIPNAFGAAGWLFGLGYFVVNAVHTGLFAMLGGADVVQTLRGGFAAYNSASALLVLVGGFLPPGGPRYAAWVTAFAVHLVTPYLNRIGGFSVSPRHFVERHGLVVIIALGESIIAIGVGASGLQLDLGLVAVAVLGLVVAYYLWWAYFGGNDERPEHELARRAPGVARSRAALHAFGYAHYPILLGIVAFAAGVKKAVSHADHELKLSAAVALGGGVALFLFGHGLFRRLLTIDGARYRLAASVAALATIPLGVVNATVQLAALGLVLAAAHALEYRHAHNHEPTPLAGTLD